MFKPISEYMDEINIIGHLNVKIKLYVLQLEIITIVYVLVIAYQLLTIDVT